MRHVYVVQKARKGTSPTVTIVDLPEVFIDGVKVSSRITAFSLEIEPGEPAKVTMTFIPEELTVDVDDVEAKEHADEQS